MGYYQKPQPPKKPRREFSSQHVPNTFGKIAGGLLFAALCTAIVGPIVGLIFAFFSGEVGPNQDNSGPMTAGIFVVGIGFLALVLSENHVDNDQYRRETAYYDDDYAKRMAEYDRRYADYLREMEEWPEKLREMKAFEEQQRRQEREEEEARAWALRQQREEEKRQELERQEKERAAERLREWHMALDWATREFERRYHGLLVQLAAEYGQMSQEDVIKVFATAYPHFPCSTDWRMGCLRYRGNSDPRVQAILQYLPEANAKNTRPS